MVRTPAASVEEPPPAAPEGQPAADREPADTADLGAVLAETHVI